MKPKLFLFLLASLMLLPGCGSEPNEMDTSGPIPFTQPYAEYHEEQPVDGLDGPEETDAILNEDDISDGCVEGYNEGYYHALTGEEPPYYEKSEEDIELSELVEYGYFTEDDYWEFYTVSYFDGFGDALAGVEPRYGADHGEELDEIPDLPPQLQEPSEPEPAAETAPQEQTQSVTVYVTRTGEKYHKDGCRYLWNSKIPKSLSDAKLHYTACNVCRPPQ